MDGNQRQVLQVCYTAVMLYDLMLPIIGELLLLTKMEILQDHGVM